MTVGTAEEGRESLERVRAGSVRRLVRRARLGDRPARLELVRVPPVARRQVLEAHVPGPVLHLPDVAQLVRDEVVGCPRVLEQDRSPERVAGVAAEAGDPEEPRRHKDANALEPDGPRVVLEPVEPGLRSGQRRGDLSHYVCAGASTIRKLPSCACKGWYEYTRERVYRLTACSSSGLISPMPGVSGAGSVSVSGWSSAPLRSERSRKTDVAAWPSGLGGRSTRTESIPSMYVREKSASSRASRRRSAWRSADGCPSGIEQAVPRPQSVYMTLEPERKVSMSSTSDAVAAVSTASAPTCSLSPVGPAIDGGPGV